MTTTQTGKKGEDLACRYLEELGYKILERNFRIRGGEIDIVAKDGEFLVYVEVKTRYSYQYGLPEESITSWKIRALQKSALFYNQKINWEDKGYRLDFVSVDFAEDNKNPKIKLIKNIAS